MVDRRLSGWMVAFVLACAAGNARAALGPARSTGEVSLPGMTAVRMSDPERQRALESGAAWRSFRAKHGAWGALWNEATGSPHRAFGRGIALDGFAGDADGVDRAVRRFVAGNPAVFGAATTLRRAAIHRVGDKWYASYRQTIGGLDVLFADWEFRISGDGRLFMFGADVHSPAGPPAGGPVLAPAAAREAAKAGLAFDPVRDRVEGGTSVFLLPRPAGGGFDYRPVLEAHVITADPPGNWLTYVDAATGEVLYRINRVRTLIRGTVTGLVHLQLPTNPLTPMPLPHLIVTMFPFRAVTDSTGFYLGAGTGTVTVSAKLEGLYAIVRRADAASASFSTTATHPATVDIPWGDVGISHDAERDAYYNANRVHDHVRAIDSTLTGLDYEMPLTVNYPLTCNAFWDGNGINYYAAGGGCVNLATVPDVTYHEYGHAVNDMIYQTEGQANGMQNGALQEGMADVRAALLEDDPIIGQGFGGPGTFVRELDHHARWPENNVAEVHSDGLIVAGAFWDLRQSIGLATTEALQVRALHGTPDDPYDPVAFTEMFLEVLAADDDDADLTNGTPHGAQIVAAFNAHGIGTDYFISIESAAVADVPAGDLVPITAVIRYTGPPITALDATSPTVHFSVNRGPWSTARLVPTGAADQFSTRIPVPAASIAEYYVTASDGTGGTASSPTGAPLARVYRFLAGPALTKVSWDMESDPGWTVGAPTDDAIAGVWVRDTSLVNKWGFPPNVVLVQPRGNHTPSGSQCFVTGNADTFYLPGMNSVEGTTTLTTASFDAATDRVHPMIEYYRWYSNDTGSAPGTTFWEADLSNDGGATWTSVEHTNASDASWQRVLFRVEDYLTPSANMKMRFVASNPAFGPIVEAAVDDFRLLAFAPGTVSAPPPAVPDAVALAAPFPNPFRTRATLRFTLPSQGRVTLGLYDVAGRAVRTVVDGVLPAGSHATDWDGRDALGNALPGGLYFARLVADGHEVVRRVMRLP